MSLRDSSFLMVNGDDASASSSTGATTLDDATKSGETSIVVDAILGAITPLHLLPKAFESDENDEEEDDASSSSFTDASSSTTTTTASSGRFTVRRHVIAIYNHTFANKFDFDWVRLLEYVDQHAHRVRPSAYVSGERSLNVESLVDGGTAVASETTVTEPIDVFDCIATLAVLDDDVKVDDAQALTSIAFLEAAKQATDERTISSPSTTASLNASSLALITLPQHEEGDVIPVEGDNEEDDDDGNEIFHYKIVIVCSDQHHELPSLRAWQTQLKVLAEMPSLSVEYELYGPEFPVIRQHWMAMIERQLKGEDERFRERYASEDDRKVWLDDLLSPALTSQILYTGTDTRRLVPDMASRWIGEMMEHEAIIFDGIVIDDDDDSSDAKVKKIDGVRIQVLGDSNAPPPPSSSEEEKKDDIDDDDASSTATSSDTSDIGGYIDLDSPPVQLLLIEDEAMAFTLAHMRSSWRPLFSNTSI